MNFKKKVFLIILGGSTLMVAAILLLSYLAYVKTSSSIAQQEVLHTFHHAQALLIKELEHLNIANADWSVWDDMYQYVLDRNKKFEKANLQANSFQILKISTFSIYDQNGRVIFNYPANSISINESSAIMAMRAAAIKNGSAAGFAEVDGSFFFATAHSIAKSDGSGPPLGTLVMTRIADRNALSELISILDSEISFEKTNKRGSQVEPQIADFKGGVFEAAGPILNDDLDSEINLHVRPEKRVIIFDGSTFIGFIAVGLFVILIISGLILILLERHVIRRIDRVGKELKSISVSGKIDRRLIVDGDDEISRLGTIMNQTFDSLEKSFEIIEQGKLALEKSLEERESLFREIRHRVKNNLQVVASLLSMQADAAESPFLTNAFLNSHRRVLAMANVHEELYCSESLNSIDLRDYLEHLASHIRYDLDTDNQIQFGINVAEIELSIEKALPFALITNEVLTNAFTHAFRDGETHINREKRIKLSLQRDGTGGCILNVADTGCGIHDKSLKKGALGLTLISALSAQMKAAYTYDSLAEGGTEFRMTFKLDS